MISCTSMEKDIDALFQLPLAGFTQARNALASRLKKDGHLDEAEKVRALAKPPISAWVVNQLYWRHREAFTNLMAAGRRLVQAQVSQLAGKAADVNRAQADRREALSALSHLADALLREAGHQATTETNRRIHTTLEALSTYSAPDIPPFGRLTQDLDPAGFESIAALFPAAAQDAVKPTRVIPFRPRDKQARQPQKDEQDASVSSARTALRAAEEELKKAGERAEVLAAAQTKAAGEAKDAEKNRLEAEERYDAARVAERDARRKLQQITIEAEKAAKAADNAARGVDKARADLKEK